MTASSPETPSPSGPLWRADEAADATGGAMSGPEGWAATGINFDSRLIQPGDLFVALRGEGADGHDYIAKAFEARAVAALAVQRPADLPADAPLLLVDDTLKALERLGAAGRARATNARIAAVTGSVGKTSTKDMLALALGVSGATHAAAKSFNNHIGVPLTLARMPADSRFGVFEIGMSAPGEIAPLATLVRPHVAIVTTVAPVHTAAFEDGVEGVAREKASIFQGLEPGGVAVIDRGSPFFPALSEAATAAGAEILEFGRGARDAELLDVRLSEDTTLVRARLFGDETLFKLGAPGRHFAGNALAVLAATQALGGDIARAALALGGWSALDGRGARTRLRAPGGEILLVDESYNANPASMAAALETFSTTTRGVSASGGDGRRIAFLTDMLELGPQSDALHAGLRATPGFEAIDLVHCAGPAMAALHAALPKEHRGRLFDDAEAMAEAAGALLVAGDAVLVKGSNGSRAHAVAAAIASAFPAVEADGSARPETGAS